MFDTDFSSPFPEHLKPSVLQQKVDEQVREHIQDIYSACLLEIEKYRIPCTVKVPLLDEDSLIDDSVPAIMAVIKKIKNEGGYDCEYEPRGTKEMSHYVIIIFHKC